MATQSPTRERDIAEAPGLTARQLSLLRLSPCAECGHPERDHGGGYLNFSCRSAGCDCFGHQRREDVQAIMVEYERSRRQQKDDEDFGQALAALLKRAEGRPERVRRVYEAMAGLR